MTYPGTLPTTPSVGSPLTATQGALIAQALTYLASMDAPFRAVGTNGLSVSANTNIAFVTADDTLSAWNATTHVWTCPVAGRYQFNAQVRCGAVAAAPNCSLIVNGAALQGFNAAPTSVAGANALVSVMRSGFAVGDTVAIQSSIAYVMSATAAVDNYLSIFRVGT